jgi:hypothetical protein
VLQLQEHEDGGRAREPKGDEREKVLVPFHRPIGRRTDEPNDQALDRYHQGIEERPVIGEDPREIGSERPNGGRQHREEYEILLEGDPRHDTSSPNRRRPRSRVPTTSHPKFVCCENLASARKIPPRSTNPAFFTGLSRAANIYCCRHGHERPTVPCGHYLKNCTQVWPATMLTSPSLRHRCRTASSSPSQQNQR